MIAPEIPELRMRRPIPRAVDHEPRHARIRLERHAREIARVEMRRLHAEQAGRVGMIAADHVGVEHGHDLVALDDGMPRVPARAEESALLRAMPDEERRATAGLSRERAADREQRDAHRRVVVGAVVDGVATHRRAHAVVILMRAEKDVLVA